MRYFLIFLFAFVPLICGAQVAMRDDIQARLDAYNDHYQPEYAEFVLDKDFYFTGERIWYSLWLRNETLTTSSLSSIAYVEIRDGNDSAILRQKIRSKFGRAHGELIIPEPFPTGYYKIVAYTAWMKNNGTAGYYQQLVPIINTDNPVSSTETQDTKTFKKADPIIKLTSNGSHSYKVKVPDGQKGELIAMNSEEVVGRQDLQAISSFDFNKSNDHIISILLADTVGKIIEEQQIVNSNINSILTISVGGKTPHPRSTTELVIALSDKQGYPVNGSVAVSIRPKHETDFINNKGTVSMNYEMLLRDNSSPLIYKKELFVYPASKNSFPMISFSPSKKIEPMEILVSELQKKKMIEAALLKKKVMQYYSVNSIFEPDDAYNLKSNNSYEPKDYANLPTLEEFIREAVPTLRVRNLSGEKAIRVRNSDNLSRIYFFKEAPFIMIDHVGATAQEFLNVPISDVERIDVIWALTDINSLGLFSIADGGVVYLTTKSRMSYSQSKMEIFKGIHTPLKFSIPKFNEKEKLVPVIVDPLFWNPDVVINGRTRLLINTDDGLGTYIVRVNGFTETGDYVSETAEFTVTLNPN